MNRSLLWFGKTKSFSRVWILCTNLYSSCSTLTPPIFICMTTRRPWMIGIRYVLMMGSEAGLTGNACPGWGQKNLYCPLLGSSFPSGYTVLHLRLWISGFWLLSQARCPLTFVNLAVSVSMKHCYEKEIKNFKLQRHANS